jgi:hypothetical protein
MSLRSRQGFFDNLCNLFDCQRPVGRTMFFEYHWQGVRGCFFLSHLTYILYGDTQVPSRCFGQDLKESHCELYWQEPRGVVKWEGIYIYIYIYIYIRVQSLLLCSVMFPKFLIAACVSGIFLQRENCKKCKVAAWQSQNLQRENF